MLVAGQACLIVAFVCALYGVAASLYGARSHRREWVASGRRAVYAMALSTAVAFVLLETAFVRSDFDFAVVASHSSTTTPLFYRLTAMWSSQEGSLLLWLFLLGAWSSLILFITRHRLRVLAPYATGVLLGFGAFFSGLLVFAESPFTRAPMRVSEGAGLNPLLRDPGMMIHPPMLYAGYTLFAIPFAFAVAALITRRLDAEWIRSTRPFTLGGLVRARLRDRARRALVLPRARLGRLLDVGPGGERVADAMADRDGVPALGDDPGAARDAADVERLAGAGDRRAGDPRHVPGALRRAELDPRVRRLHARRAVPDC